MEQNRSTQNANFCRLVMYISSLGCEVLEEVILNVVFNDLLADEKRRLELAVSQGSVALPFERLYPTSGPLPRFDEFDNLIIEEIFHLNHAQVELKEYLRTSGLQMVLTKHRDKMFKNHKRIGEKMWKKINTNSGVVDIKELDVSVLGFIFRNISKHSQRDWNNMPMKEEVAIKDDVCRIIWYRNKLAHYRATEPISESDFQSMWLDLTLAFERLCHDRQKVERISNEMKRNHIDENQQEQYEKLVDEWIAEEAENVEKIKRYISNSQDDTVCKLSEVVKKGVEQNKEQLKYTEKAVAKLTKGFIDEMLVQLEEQRSKILEDSNDSLKEQLESAVHRTKAELGDVIVDSMKHVGFDIERKLSDIVTNEMDKMSTTLADPLKEQVGTIMTDCLNKAVENIEQKVVGIVNERTVSIIETLLNERLDDLSNYIVSTVKTELIKSSQSDILAEIIRNTTDTVVDKLAEEHRQHIDTLFQQSVPRSPDGNFEPKCKPTDPMKFEVQTWFADAQDFIATSAYRGVVDRLEFNKHLTVVGPPMSGKTMIARCAARHFRSKGYTVFPISNPTEIKQFLSNEGKQLFVIDDPFGKNSVNLEKLREWREIDERMRAFIKKDDVKILWVMNIEQTKEHVFQTARLVFAEPKIDITSQELTCEERKGILMKHFENTFLEDEDAYGNVLDVAASCDFFFFPRICKQFKQISKWQQNLANPFHFPFETLVDYFEHIQYSSKYQFCALGLCALSGNLPSNHGSLRDVISSGIGTMYLDVDFSDANAIKATLNSMTGTWVRRSKEHWGFSHEIYRDVILFLMGKRELVDPSILLRNMSCRCVQERIKYDQEKPVEVPDEYVFVLGREHWKELSLRLCCDLINLGYEDSQIPRNDYYEADVLQLLTKTLASGKLEENNFLAVIALSIRTENADLLNTCLRNKPELINRHFSEISYHIDTDIIGFSPLHFAVWRRSHWGVDKLLKCSEIDVDLLSREGAIRNKDQELHSDLIETGASHNIQSNEGLCPVHFAIKLNDIDIVEKLVRAGADMKKFTSEGLSPLHLAIELNKTKMVEKLIEVDVDTNFRDENGQPPLNFALEQNEPNVDIVAMLANHSKTEVNPSDGCDHPLNIAVCKGDFISVHTLLSCERMNVNISDGTGSTALHIAARNNAIPIATLLLEKADPSLKNINDETPLNIAERKGHSQIAEFIRHFISIPKF
ncbi:uncharacterized protein LOC117336162 [Pecten maximus]|uniref:uncharacterized protein LOC117336162 n=1 Tax=Pecten maximus TaxID=6579 RepID=UPI001458B49B|nr:uncharacterized protein LOC117336162 [Pecten maximus]XP_033752441.1 uncharacterized protein LOC117336162 [Pecten maximus]